jgi:RHS repeat-associated protein
MGGHLTVSLSSPGPLLTGTAETLTAVLTDSLGHAIGDFIVQVSVTGANPTTGTVTTDATGTATFTYVGWAPGTDVLQTIAIGGTAQLQAAPLMVSWTPAPPGGGNQSIIAQGWIGAPAQRAIVMGLVPITVAPGVTVSSATVSYWPSAAPTAFHTLATSASGGPGATLATLDTTTLSNGGYVIDVSGTDNHGNAQDNEILVTVAGDYKPGREVVDVTEFTVPIAGTPIVVGRRYDSLNKDTVGDFGHGWSLTVGHPDLEVDLAKNVTITMPNGRRATFFFGLQSVAAGPIVLGFLAQPTYVPEPGVFGTLTSDGCNLLSFNPFSDNPSPICFDSLFDPVSLQYSPMTYTYTDPYGVVYTMGADGTLKSIQDRNHNILTFSPTGITSPVTGQTVSFTRDDQGRITQILAVDLGDFFHTRFEYDYVYDGAGNLVQVTAPAVNIFTEVYHYGYDGSHRLTSAIDPAGNHTQTSTYDSAGRLATDTDAMGNLTRYGYDVAGHTTTTTYPDTGVMTQTLDDRGLVLVQTDQLGRTTKHQYDANRNEVKRTNALGEVTTYAYDANGNQTSMVNALGETTLTTYNAFSEPLTSTNPIGNTTTIAYDDQGLPTSMTDSLGVLATFTSSEHGLPITVTDATGNTVFLNYDGSGDLTSRIDRLGRQTSYSYDTMGRKLTTTDPRGGVTHYEYDEQSDLLLARNPLGFGPRVFVDADRNIADIVTAGSTTSGETEFFFDANNNLIRTQHNNDVSMIHQTSDFRRNLLTLTDEVGNTTSHTYDVAGQLIQTTNADGTFTAQSYDALGRLASKTDERGNTTTFAYQAGCDCSNRLTGTTDPLHRTTSSTYDAMARRTSMTDASGRQTSYVYDLRGHLVETDYPDATATHDTYDLLGRRIASKDQTGATTQYGYDTEGQLVSVTDALGHVTGYAYDPNGNLTSVTDANNHTTTYAYDAANQKTGRTLPLGMTEAFAYDADGNNIGHTDFRGKTTTFPYDNRRPGRLTGKVPDPSLSEPTVSYAYNLNSTRASMVDASGTTTYGYDARNRLLTKATPAGTLTYAYDGSGNLASIRSSNANGTSVDYAWDAANELASVTDNRLGGITTSAYTATGRPAHLLQPNGVGATYSYDNLDRVTSMASQKGGASAFASWAYTYSDRGQRLTATDVTGREAAYGYDTASRLTSETVSGDPRGAIGNGVLAYALDPVGNRLTRISTLPALGAQSFEYDANDQLASDAYDPNGNTIASAGNTYTYDFDNRLVAKNGGAVTIEYDGDGNRVAKTVVGVTTHYLVDDLNPTGYLQVLEELSGGVVQTRYTYGSMIVSQTRQISGSPQTSFYGYDAHGNIASLTDIAGAVTDTYQYDAWGSLIGRAGTTPNVRLFAGEELDPDIGLINLRARQYAPDTGRFLTIDALAGTPVWPNTLNRYLFANADPIGFIDPSGYSAAVEGAIVQSITQTVLYVSAFTVIAYATVCELYFIEGLLNVVDAPDVSPMFRWCVAMTGGGHGGPKSKSERGEERKQPNAKKDKYRLLPNGQWQKQDRFGRWKNSNPPPLAEP